jgi:hypothetical protein
MPVHSPEPIPNTKLPAHGRQSEDEDEDENERVTCYLTQVVGFPHLRRPFFNCGRPEDAKIGLWRGLNQY